MNTINSASHSNPVTESPAGEAVAETSDPSALEILKALLEKPSGSGSGTDDGFGDDDQKGPDWSMLEGLATPGVPLPATVVSGDGKGGQAPVADTGSQPQFSAPVLPGTLPESGKVAEFAAQALKSMVKGGEGAAPPVVVADAPAEAAAVEVKPDTLGSAILDSFFSQSSGVSAPAPPAAAEPASPMAERVAQIENLMNTMVDRVLVTDPLSGQNQEVRIKFQEGILPGTEARVWREDGRVMVEFVSTRAESVRWLEGSIAMLSHRLDERLHQTAPSVVTVNSSGDAPSDGRSRERNTPWDQARQQQQQQEEATA
ncbi:hypothetical protein [Verrucomicrobium sp. BvORR034]|uniref:hypothetical protein n=1 Tax=Verrucomicrobium sp. BvORR034 TaxID=1396418 RepID=UPI002240F032|nr:hypothetical protein [Verrucomicrobium sp. BvORR034]